MALQAEHVETTASGLAYKARYSERPRTLTWARLRSINAEVEPAWSGAEITVVFGFEGDGSRPDAAPLAAGRRLEVFGNVAAARAMIDSARAHSPEALVGPMAGLLVSLPEPEGGDEEWYRRKLKDYAFASAAGLALGKQHLARGRLLAAERALAAVVARDPRDSTAWRLLGLTHTLAGNGRKGERAYNELLGLGARDTEAYLLHAFSLYRQRRFQQAGEELERVLRAQAHDPAIRTMLACSHVQQWRIPDALRELGVVGSDTREGWRLMARKCSMCASGYRAYQERLANDRLFRWKERWKLAAARIAGALWVLFSMFQYVITRAGWVWLIGIAVVAVILYLVDRGRASRQAQDQLADAQGQAPNMPCWYASFVWRGNRPFTSRRSVLEEIQRRWGGEG